MIDIESFENVFTEMYVIKNWKNLMNINIIIFIFIKYYKWYRIKIL
jgi:hypothetical protein